MKVKKKKMYHLSFFLSRSLFIVENVFHSQPQTGITLLRLSFSRRLPLAICCYAGQPFKLDKVDRLGLIQRL